MYILVDDTRVDIVSQTVNRHDSRRGLVLTITTTRENISLGDLDALCTDIMANKSDILVYNDNDELVTALHGFCHNCIVSSDAENGTIKAEITNESENTFQIGLLQGRSTNLEAAAQAHTVQIEETAEVVLAQSEAIATQMEQVGCLTEQSVANLEAIELIMLDVIPSVVQSAIQEALADILPSEDSMEVADDVVEVPEEPVVEE